MKKVRTYFEEVWNEVKWEGGKVTWPSNEEVKGSTIVVIVTVALMAVYFAVVDTGIGWAVAKMLGVR
ncbi:MAG: preprotein translocase subunit SecE [Candidatus Hydrogenedentota bacterium]|nr:MAG: preprotein translocase subunit SecE [Candidatus Hydrogenedentota bacterium]